MGSYSAPVFDRVEGVREVVRVIIEEIVRVVVGKGEGERVGTPEKG